jgi:hypothetical protein
MTVIGLDPSARQSTNADVIVQRSHADQRPAKENSPLNPWDVSKLPVDFGMVAPSRTSTGWQPLNLGISPPMFALGPSRTIYLANSAGVWRLVNNRWLLLEGSTSLGNVTGMTVSNQGSLYVIANSQVWNYKDHRWIQLSNFHQQSLRFLTWTPQGNLAVGIDDYPSLQTDSLHFGPAPIPSLGLMEYTGHEWIRRDGLVPYANKQRIRHVAWSNSGHLALSFDYAKVGVLAGHGWLFLGGSGTPLDNNSVVNDITWLGNAVLIATNHGVWRYQFGQWSHVQGIPTESNVVALSVFGKDAIIETQNPDLSYTCWLGHDGDWSKIPLTMMGLRFAGDSPKGVPFVELLGPTSHREIWQFINGSWKSINMKGFPVETHMEQYDPWFPRDLTWSPSGFLTVSSRNHGVWQWNGSRWTKIGNSIDPHHPYSTGDIAWMSNGTLVANVYEMIPPPPATPRMLHNMLWTFQGGRWHHLLYPKSVTENVIEGIDVSPQSNSIVVAVGSGIVHIWLWTKGSWREIGNGTGPLQHLRSGDVSFAPNGHVMVPLSDPADPSQNGLYEYNGSRWVQVLHNPAPLREKNTYWFHAVWAHDGSIIFSLMNAKGYHLLRYAKDKWTDLGLSNQDITRILVLPDGTLFAITDSYVGWVKKL